MLFQKIQRLCLCKTIGICMKFKHSSSGGLEVTGKMGTKWKPYYFADIYNDFLSFHYPTNHKDQFCNFRNES